jgi:hypothetical protein
MNSYEYIKHVMRRAANYTFNRMGFYLTLFNFFMLANWMYENTDFGDMLKNNGFRPGDTLLIILFAIFAISALEYVVIGRDKELAQQQAQDQEEEQ